MSKPFRIGIAGLGTVGAGVVKAVRSHEALLAERAGRKIQITHISARSKNKDRGVDLSGMQWLDNPEDLAAQDLDAVVELIGGAEGPARTLVQKSLEKGTDVVTANKAMLAHHGHELAALAEKNNSSLSFEASVAGCIPIIKSLREGFSANQVDSVYGILNGTCNYILTQMRETGRDFADVLKEAQDKGYAEADPAFDIEGKDAGHKICILAALAFGVRPDFKSVAMTGISAITQEDIRFAGELGYKIKLLGIAKFSGGRVLQSVEPCLVPAASTLGAVEDVMNAVSVRCDLAQMPMLTGRGAGEMPTSSAVLADIIDLARGVRVAPFGVPASKLKTAQAQDAGESMTRHYMRLTVLDQPGVIADVAAILRDKKISIESMLQRGRDPGQPVPVIMKTHKARRADMTEACRQIEALNSSVQKPSVLRIEDGL